MSGVAARVGVHQPNRERPKRRVLEVRRIKKLGGTTVRQLEIIIFVYNIYIFPPLLLPSGDIQLCSNRPMGLCEHMVHFTMGDKKQKNKAELHIDLK